MMPSSLNPRLPELHLSRKFHNPTSLRRLVRRWNGSQGSVL
ncbi:hypothetical protein CDL12_26891 [Handroanthus impetiginosus]|uniref:Uncharacterized protein n=1 Tax=Handroanthus impetiginosus TaxID=429701 RepID=A0A2G9G5L6_9LAMI|nr:hypothetical protein CDL12_26891 [Handroanthus impetiginosus]